MSEYNSLLQKISRIAITYPSSPFKDPGGGARSCLQIARHLGKMGVDVNLLHISDNQPFLLDDSAVSVIPVSEQKGHYFLNAISFRRAICDLHQHSPLDAILCWDYEAAFLTKYLTANNITLGMIAAHPSYEILLTRSEKNRWLVNTGNAYFRWRMFHLADAVFVSSEFTRRELTNLFSIDDSCIRTIYRGIDTVFTRAPSRLPSSEVSNFIFYGSLAPIKGVFDVIEALGLVAERGYRNWKLKIAGWGEVEKVGQAIRQQGIADNVTFLGRLEPDELRSELDWAHLALLPSRAESFGRAIAEAQATGLAVISYDSGSVSGIVEDGITGWLVPPMDIKCLASSIIEAMSDPKRVFQMGLTGREKALERFIWERVAGLILEGLGQSK